MEKIRNWFINFMSGRYGFDEYGRSLCIDAVVLFIVSIVLSLLAELFANIFKATNVGVFLSLLSTVLNWAAIIVLFYMAFRMLSRKHDKRRQENQRYLSRRSGRQSTNDISVRDHKDYKYMDCPFCGQKMRVPRGKGKIAVKCPSCGEKTITKS